MEQWDSIVSTAGKQKHYTPGKVWVDIKYILKFAYLHMDEIDYLCGIVKQNVTGQKSDKMKYFNSLDS